MDLKKWMQKEDISPRELSAMLECGLSTIYLWIQGKFMPNKHYQKLIVQASKGKVTFKKSQEEDKDKKK